MCLVMFLILKDVGLQLLILGNLTELNTGNRDNEG